MIGTTMDHFLFQKLLREARDGDSDALGQLLENCRPALRLFADHLVISWLKAKADRSDVIQEVFVNAVELFQTFEGSTRPQFMAWLRKGLKREIADQKRTFGGTLKRDVRKEVGINWALDQVGTAPAFVDFREPEPCAELQKQEQLQAARRVFAKLPTVFRELLRMRYSRNWSWETIGVKLRVAAGTARKWHDAAIKDFADALTPTH